MILLGIEQGDEVICSSFTFSATVNPILYQGATAIFIDSEFDTWNMDPGQLETAIKDRINKGRKLKAIFLVHLYEMPAKLEGYSWNKLGVRQVACTTIPRSQADNPTLPTYSILGASGFIGSYFVHELIITNSYKEIFLIYRNESIEKYNELYSSYSEIFILRDTD